MSTLTSHNSPLQIASIQCVGEIGITLCPGKNQSGAQSGHFARDLKQDLDLVKSWGATAVVTLMSSAELEALSVIGIGAQVEARDMLWFHLPIEDQKLPDGKFETSWLYAGLRLRQLLRDGNKILLHCRSGLGRSGLVAARLLIELGVDPDVARDRVRAARIGTLQSTQQGDYLSKCTPADNDAWLDRMLGCLLGGAVGDAFGYAVEFDSLATIKQRFGSKGITQPVFNNEQLVVSDDTQMTLFTLEGLLRCTDDRGELCQTNVLDEIRYGCLDWLESQKGGHTVTQALRGHLAAYPAMRLQRAPGNTCMSALAQGGTGTMERRINDSKGCGGVMRTAPIGFLREVDYFDIGARAAAQTHGHMDGWAPAGILPRIIARLINGEEKFLAVRNGFSDASEWGHAYGETAKTDLYHLARDLARKMRFNPEQAIARLGQGWVGDEALAIAMYCFLSAHDFSDAIHRASNHEGDSDSTASLTGQLWGAAYGIAGVPHHWIRRLDVLQETLMLALLMRTWQRQVGYRGDTRRHLSKELAPCIRLLEMTLELHSMGYQRLRIFPYIAPTGHWRMEWVPADAFRDSPIESPKGDNPRLVARYSSASAWEPFGWQHAQTLSAHQMAKQFLQQFPALALASHGQDWTYTGWLTALLGDARKGRLPYMVADDYEFTLERGVPLIGGGVFPLPPNLPGIVVASSDVMEDEDPVPADFDFGDLSSRTHGLVAFYHKGEAYLLQVNQLIWQLLPEPKHDAATRLCAMSDHHGTGKFGLHELLGRFLIAADEACAEAAARTDENWVDEVGQMDFGKVEHTFAKMDKALLAHSYSFSGKVEKVVKGQ